MDNKIWRIFFYNKIKDVWDLTGGSTSYARVEQNYDLILCLFVPSEFSFCYFGYLWFYSMELGYALFFLMLIFLVLFLLLCIEDGWLGLFLSFNELL